MSAMEESTRRKFIIRVVILTAVVLAASVGGALAVSETQTPSTGAEVQLLVDAAGFRNKAEADRYLASLEIIADSPLITDGVSERTGVEADDVRKALSVDTIGQSSVMRMRAVHEDGDTALALVTESLAGFTDLLTSETSPEVKDSIRLEILELTAHLEDIDDQLAEIEVARRAESPDGALSGVTAEESRLLAESDSTLARVSLLEDQLFEIQLAEADQVNRITPLGSPRITGEVPPLPTKQAIALGGFIGLLVASLLGTGLWLLMSRSGRPAPDWSAFDGAEEAAAEKPLDVEPLVAPEVQPVVPAVR